MKHVLLDPTLALAPTRDHGTVPAAALPPAKATTDERKPGLKDASIYFVGTATTVLEWGGARILTDPNFLHAGDHVHLGPGVTAERLTNPAVDLHDLPRIDAVLLSHYHEDHFDREVEDSLRRDLPIITTPHAYHHLAEVKEKDQSFTHVHSLDHYESLFLDIQNPKVDKQSVIKVTGTPGKHVPPGPAHVLETINDLMGIVPPTNGWMLELGYRTKADDDDSFQSGYRIYITGDTLMVDDLKTIPERYRNQRIDLMLIHLGGTSIPSAKMPLLMVTMDEKQGLELVQLINPDITIPIHYDDYDVFSSPLQAFKDVIANAGLSEKVVYLGRGDKYTFKVQDTSL